ncbi:MAG: TMEM43 family protein [Dokdonella sp.]
MKRKRGRRSSGLLIALLLVAALAGAGWYLLHRKITIYLPRQTETAPALGVPFAVAIDRVDVANESRNVVVSGTVEARTSARDTELGIGAPNALALLRQVEMRQWRETCTTATCEYALVWSDKPIDWHAFRQRSGHENSTPFPFSSQRFLASGVRLGAFNVDPVLAAATVEPAVFPVHIAQLPPNLAASFREEGGVLYTGGAGAAPAAGDLRINYRIVPSGEHRLSAIQKGDRLVAPPR